MFSHGAVISAAGPGWAGLGCAFRLCKTHQALRVALLCTCFPNMQMGAAPTDSVVDTQLQPAVCAQLTCVLRCCVSSPCRWAPPPPTRWWTRSCGCTAWRGCAWWTHPWCPASLVSPLFWSQCQTRFVHPLIMHDMHAACVLGGLDATPDCLCVVPAASAAQAARWRRLWWLLPSVRRRCCEARPRLLAPPLPRPWRHKRWHTQAQAALIGGSLADRTLPFQPPNNPPNVLFELMIRCAMCAAAPMPGGLPRVFQF